MLVAAQPACKTRGLRRHSLGGEEIADVCSQRGSATCRRSMIDGVSKYGLLPTIGVGKVISLDGGDVFVAGARRLSNTKSPMPQPTVENSRPHRQIVGRVLAAAGGVLQVEGEDAQCSVEDPTAVDTATTVAVTVVTGALPLMEAATGIMLIPTAAALDRRSNDQPQPPGEDMRG